MVNSGTLNGSVIERYAKCYLEEVSQSPFETPPNQEKTEMTFQTVSLVERPSFVIRPLEVYGPQSVLQSANRSAAQSPCDPPERSCLKLV
jgi:hypothetical protein